MALWNIESDIEYNTRLAEFNKEISELTLNINEAALLTLEDIRADINVLLRYKKETSVKKFLSDLNIPYEKNKLFTKKISVKKYSRGKKFKITEITEDYVIVIMKTFKQECWIKQNVISDFKAGIIKEHNQYKIKL